MVKVVPPPPPLPGASADSLGELGVPRFFGPQDGVAPAWAFQDGHRALFAYVTTDSGQTWEATSPIPIDQGLGSPIFFPSLPSASVWVMASMR